MRARTLCVYGTTGTYKTTNVGRFARYIYEKTGRATRLLSADGGGWESCQPEIGAGIIQPLSLLESNNILPTLRHLSRGDWPELRDNMVLGWKALHENDNVGAYAIEGTTSISLMALRDMTIKGRKISEDVVGQFKEDDELFAAPARSHYGFVQSFMIDLVLAFAALPVPYVMWTGHEGKGEDFLSKTIVYGPGTVGKAATDKLPPLFGDLIHLEPVCTKLADKTESQEVRAYIRNHPDSQNPGIFWPAKIRIQPGAISEVAKRWPSGYFTLSSSMGIDDYLRFQDELATKYTAEADNWKAEVDAKRAITTTNNQQPTTNQGEE